MRNVEFCKLDLEIIGILEKKIREMRRFLDLYKDETFKIDGKVSGEDDTMKEKIELMVDRSLVTGQLEKYEKHIKNVCAQYNIKLS